MLERMPENIKKAYIISIININLLVNGVHKILYFQNNPKFRGNFEYLKRMAIFCFGMFIVGKVSQKYFESHVLTNIAATGAGALNFKISYLLCHLKEKFLLSKK